LRIGDKLNERGYHYVVYAGSGCIGCNNCFYDCPEPNAIEVHIPYAD
jgi:NAD-dependent dihydropyrimidine dehydrogenase PreA subunit